VPSTADWRNMEFGLGSDSPGPVGPRSGFLRILQRTAARHGGHLASGLVALTAFALGAWSAPRGVPPIALALLGSMVLALVVSLHLERLALRPLATAATLLDALRRGDYAHRARTRAMPNPSLELLREVNQLAQHLEDERRRREETQALLQSLIERVDVAVLAFDENARLVWWNPAAERVFRSKLRNGVAAQAIGAESFLSGPSERSVHLDGFAPQAAFELRRGVFRRGGERYQFVLLSSAERVRRQEERSAWQRLVRVLGHEVNNTLAPIQSLAGTCRGLLQDDRVEHLPAVLRALDAVEHRAGALGRFIAQFASLARLPEPTFAPIDLGVTLRRLAALDQRCPIDVSCRGSLPVVADAALLEQALTNILRNAVDAAVTTDGRVGVNWDIDDENVCLSIVDEGPGVTNPDNLFVPLFTTKSGGSGIGLVLARNIVEAHGGYLTLENRKGAKGCIATLQLPKAPPPAATTAAPPPADTTRAP
jgi:two-component system, NtrC family, nitrogen regulation sensor histidine kinase NtrY